MARLMVKTWTALLLFLCLPLPGLAETVYVDGRLTVGLHQDNDIDSPIIKTLTSGTALEVIKRDTPLTNVKEPGGGGGWIDNQYLAEQEPGNAGFLQLQEKAAKLEAELSALRATTRNMAPAPDADVQKFAALRKENEDLKQQLHSEQLKTGELQAQAAELRNQLSQAGGAEEAVSGIETPDSGETADAATVFADIYGSIGPGNLRVILIGMTVCIIIGLIGGAYFMDWMSRRRHGGFRI